MREPIRGSLISWSTKSTSVWNFFTKKFLKPAEHWAKPKIISPPENGGEIIFINSLLKLLKLERACIQTVILSLFLYQLLVTATLDNATVVKHHNNI